MTGARELQLPAYSQTLHGLDDDDDDDDLADTTHVCTHYADTTRTG